LCDNLNNNAGSQDPKAECQQFGGCKWNDEMYYCSSDGKVPCALSYPEGDNYDKCPSGCQYSDITSGCIEQGSKPLCEVIYDEADCKKNGCTFSDVLYKCWDTDRQIPCQEFEYYGSENCPKYCQFTQTGGDAADGEGRCMVQGGVTACEEYYDEGECPKERCNWYPDPIDKCWAKDKEIPCSDFDAMSCAPAKTCKWNKDTDATDDFQGWCGKCPTSDCTEAVPGGGGGGGNDEPSGGDIPDDGKPCKDHDENMDGDDFQPCPEPRCYMDYGMNDDGSTDMCGAYSGGNCRDAVCNDHMYDEVSCEKQSGCAFDTTSNICYDTSGDFPCQNAYTNSECPSAHCDWKDAPVDSSGSPQGDGFCVVKGQAVPCERYSGFTGDICEAQSESGDNCIWIEALETCVTKARAEDMPCAAYNQDPSRCPEPKCTLENGICWEVGKEIPCSAVCSSGSCLATGKCQWKQESSGMGYGQCSECSAGGCPAVKECSTYKDEMTCPESHCTFEYNDMETDDDDFGGMGGGGGMGGSDDMGGGGSMAGECVKHQCVTMYDQGECTSSALGCTWNANDYSCWPNGFSKPCSDIWDQDACSAAGCSYVEEMGQCREKGGEVLCHDQYEQADCIKLSQCEYTNYECQEKRSVLPSTPPPLNGNGDGTGNEDPTKCTPALYDQVKAKLEAADSECIVEGRKRSRRGSSQDQQLECLAYFLEQAPNPTTVATACPCLWAWATEIKPWEDHWMKIKC